jgi:hypothetical protein
MRCYCSICRKTAGAGGYAINLAGDNTTLKVEGEENITIYRAKIQNPEDPEPYQSEGERRFCRHCGSCLWVYDPSYPELMHPFASAIDTDLSKPPEHTHIMLDFAIATISVIPMNLLHSGMKGLVWGMKQRSSNRNAKVERSHLFAFPTMSSAI